MLEPFRGVAGQVHMVPIPGHSCFSPEDLREIAADLEMSAQTHDDVEAALAEIPAGAPTLIFGSLYLAGTVLAANEQIPT